MKTAEQVLEEYRAKYGPLDSLTKDALRQSIQYDLEHPEEVDNGQREGLMEYGQRIAAESRKRLHLRKA